MVLELLPTYTPNHVGDKFQHAGGRKRLSTVHWFGNPYDPQHMTTM